MVQWIQNTLVKFTELTGLTGKLSLDILGDTRLYLVLGVAFLLLGIRLYRGLVSFGVFLGVAAAMTLWLRGRAGWQQTVTAFVLIGLLVSAMFFSFKTLDAALLCGFVTAVPLYTLGLPWWGSGLLGLLFGAAAWFFPLAGVLTGSAMLGGLLLGGTGLLPGWLCRALMPVGIGAQYALFGKKQKLFTKCVPDRLKDRLERRKAGSKP